MKSDERARRYIKMNTLNAVHANLCIPLLWAETSEQHPKWRTYTRFLANGIKTKYLTKERFEKLKARHETDLRQQKQRQIYRDVAREANVKEFPLPHLIRSDLQTDVPEEDDGDESDSSVPFEDMTMTEEEMFDSG